MAKIDKRRRRQKDGTLGPVHYRARVWGPTGERSKTFDRLDDARGWASTAESDIARGSWIDPRAGKQTFGDYARAWQAIQVHRPKTRSKVESNLRLHVFPFLDEKPIASIRPTVIQAWVKDRQAHLAPATLESVFATVRSIFLAAVADRVIAESPCKSKAIKLPKKPNTEVAPPAADEVHAIIAALPDRYRTIALVAAGAGLRSGELLGLTVPRLDMLRRSLRVDHQLLMPDRGALYIGPPKTEASHRTVPLPPVVVEALAAHLAAFPAVELDLPDTTSGRETPDVRRHRLVFTNQNGGPVRRNRFHDTWRAAVSTATVEREGKRVPVNQTLTLHDLRHFYASLLIRHGESVKVVQARLGHASAMETLDTYGHLWEDNEERTRDAVQDVLGAFAASSGADVVHLVQ